MGGGISRCDPIPGPGVGDFQSPASESPISDRGFFLAPAAFGAIAHLIPDVLPFLTPLKRPATNWADFRGAIARANPRDDAGSLCSLLTHQRQRARTDPMPDQNLEQLPSNPRPRPNQIRSCPANQTGSVPTPSRKHWPGSIQSTINSLEKINTYLRFKKLPISPQGLVIV